MAALMIEVAELYKGPDRSAYGDVYLVLGPRTEAVTMAQAMRCGR